MRILLVMTDGQHFFALQKVPILLYLNVFWEKAVKLIVKQT